MQECLFKVARRWPRVRGMAQPRAYARRIIVNLALDDAHDRARRRSELDGASAVADGPARDLLAGLETRAELLDALAPDATSTGRARPALLQRLDRGPDGRGPRLLAGDRQEQRLARTRAAARGARTNPQPNTGALKRNV